MTLVFMMAESNRLPFMFKKPAFFCMGLLKGKMTLRLSLNLPSQFSLSSLPLAVTEGLILPCATNSAITAGTPPAR